MAQRSSCVLLVPVLLVIAQVAEAAQPVGVEFQVNSYTLGDEHFPAVAAASGGQFMAVWAREGDGSGAGVFGRMFDNQGNPIGMDFQVNTYTANNQGYGNNYGGVVTAKSAGGAFVVTWASYYQDGYGYGVFARSFQNDGTPTSVTDFQVNTTTTSNEGVYGGIAAAAGGTGERSRSARTSSLMLFRAKPSAGRLEVTGAPWPPLSDENGFRPPHSPHRCRRPPTRGGRTVPRRRFPSGKNLRRTMCCARSTPDDSPRR